MNTAKITPMFKEILPLNDPRIEKENAITAAWTFAHAALWSNENFNEREILHFKHLITEHFDQNETTDKNLVRFCVRVMLAKRMNEEKRFYYVLRPTLWLNKNYEYGYSNTEKMYDDLIKERINVSGSNQALFTLAFGIYKYSQNPCTQIYSLYRGKLMHLKAWSFLRVFNNAVLYQNHLNK